MTLNVRIGDDEAEMLRDHIRAAHPSLMNPVVDGPLPEENLHEVPNDVLAAIHTANHMGVWRDHQIDDWSDR